MMSIVSEYMTMSVLVTTYPKSQTHYSFAVSLLEISQAVFKEENVSLCIVLRPRKNLDFSQS